MSRFDIRPRSARPHGISRPRRPMRRARGGISLLGGLLLAVWAGSAGAVVAQDPADTAGAPGDPAAAAAEGEVQEDTLEALEPIPVEQAAEDEQIRSRLQAVFDRVPALSGVEVTVDAGIVRLRGLVVERASAEGAVELARAQEGVVFVDDGIEEITSLGTRLRTTWSRVEERSLDLIAALPLVLLAGLIVALFAYLGVLIGRWRAPDFMSDRNPFLQGLLRNFLQVAAVVAGLIIALDLLDATALVGAVVGTAGLAGLALGFAFKDIAENYLAGLLLGLRQPFSKNDHVTLGGYEGKIVRLTMRETILMTLDGNHVQIPNGAVFREPMLNYSRNPRRRFGFLVDVHPATDLSRALDCGLEALRDMSGVLDEPPPNALVQELAASTVTLRFFGWVDQREVDFGRVRSESIRMVMGALEAAGVSMPSPEYRIDMQGAEPARPGAPGDRPEEIPSPRVETGQRDISVDHAIDEQIEEDRRLAEEPDLLEDAEGETAEDGRADR